jgi:hypothetical protein
MVDLTAKPFNLGAAAVTWVQDTIGAMTLGEKIGQLFINLNVAFAPAYLDQILDKYHVGGMRYRGADAATVQAHIRYAQSKSKIPLLIASNPEMGGFGSVDDGTLVCTHNGAFVVTNARILPAGIHSPAFSPPGRRPVSSSLVFCSTAISARKLKRRERE